MNDIAKQTKLLAFGISLAIVFVVGAAIGMPDHGQMASAVNNYHNHASILDQVNTDNNALVQQLRYGNNALGQQDNDEED